MNPNVKSDYNEANIKVLEGLEAVRKRPGMYIGSTDQRGLHHLIWEIFDNSVDEVLAGYADRINVIFHKDNSITISDNGRGIPIGMHETGMYTPQVVFSKLHAGGKFDNTGAYKVAGGLHGVGASVVNALSSYLEVVIVRDKKRYYQKFESGGVKISEPKVTNATPKDGKGTTIHFLPDKSIFSIINIDLKSCIERLSEAAYLMKTLTVSIYDERTNTNETFHFEDGISGYVKKLNVDQKTIQDEPGHFIDEVDGIYVEVAFQYVKSREDEKIISFVNNIKTIDGGTHEAGFKSGLTKAFNDFARAGGNRAILKEKDPNLEGSDIRTGLTTVISLRIPENLLQFEGQTKGKLGTAEAKFICETICYEKILQYLSENATVGGELINNALLSFKAREASKKAKEDIRSFKEVTSKNKINNLAGKLIPAGVKNPLINELFIVEGDSAGGSAKKGRDASFQAVLPLRGKVINAEKSRLDELLKNEEIVSLINAIGAGLGDSCNPSKSNYNKIIVLTDADTDGAHIQVLLLTFFFKYMFKLIEAGKIYIALAPLYILTLKNRKKEYKYAWSDEECQRLLEVNKDYQVQRFKGLGQMEYEQLNETTMFPETRVLIQVSSEDILAATKRFNVLMGDNAESRRIWIDENVKFDDNSSSFMLESAEGEIDE